MIADHAQQTRGERFPRDRFVYLGLFALGVLARIPILRAFDLVAYDGTHYINQAAAMLGRPYSLWGEVGYGAGRGATLGFPTANVHQIDTLRPAEGVYAGRGWIDGTAWPAAVHLGPNRTFDEHESRLEAHLLGYQGELCGRRIEVDFIERLRDTERFDSVDLLRRVDDAAAAFQAGTLIYHGWGVPRDVPRALALLEQSARAGNANAARFLALAFDGVGGNIPKDPEVAMRWWNEAARLGDRHATVRPAFAVAAAREQFPLTAHLLLERLQRSPHGG